ncbi:MAG: tetratricopeptide repeat protein [Planctomycetales bacterium]|nr:tetratricopeptide repeat protein [Planctomycetales bacterium]
MVGIIQAARNWSSRNREQFIRWLPAWPIGLAAIGFAAWTWHGRQAQFVHDSLLQTASDLEDQQNWKAAAGYLRRYLQLHSGDTDVLARLARAMNRSSEQIADKRRALTVMTAAWRANPDDLPLALEQTRLALELRQFSQVIETSRELLAHPQIDEPDNAQIRQLAARWQAEAMYDTLAEADEFAAFGWLDVVEVLKLAVELDPGYPQHSYRLAIVYRDRLNVPSLAERAQLADTTIDRLVSDNPDSAESWLVRYRYRRRFQRTANSSEVELASIDADLDRAVLLDDRAPVRNVHILVAAAERMRERGDFDASLSFYQQALEANPQDVRPYLAIAAIWIEKGTPQARREAITVLERGLELIGHTEVPLLFPLIEQHVVLNEEALADRYTAQAQQAIQVFPEPARTTYRIQLQHVTSWRLAKHGEFSAAADQLTELLQILSPTFSRNSPSYVAQSWANVGQYRRMANDWNGAAEAYQRAAALDPAWRLEYRWAVAQRAERSGELGDAAQQYREIASTAPDALSAWTEAATIALRQQILLPPPLRDWTQFRRTIESAKAAAGDRMDEVVAIEANQLLIVGQEARALELLTTSLQNFPASAVLHRSLALLQAKRGEFEQAWATATDQPDIDGDPTQRVILQKDVLYEEGRFEDAVKLLQDAVAAEGPKELTTLRIELAWAHMQLGRWSEAKDWLDQAAKGDPNDLRVTETLGQLAWCVQDWSLLEECEATMRLIEGNYGPLWRTFRIRRILAQSTEQTSTPTSMKELDDLTEQLELLYPHMQQTRIAAGRVASYRGLLWKAVANYEEAWDLGMPRVSLAVDLISLLNELGDTQRAQRYVNEIRQYLAATQNVIDGEALDLSSESADDAIRLAAALVKENPLSDSYLRLGRTLVLTALPQSDDYQDRLERAEAAFRQAIELAPEDTRTWAALFRYLVSVRPDPLESQAVLAELQSRDDVSELNRTFVLAQLNESIDNHATAKKLYLKSIELANETEPVERLIVLERSAQYFRRFDRTLAEKCCRDALKLEPGALGPQQILLEMLLARGDAEASSEAITLVELLGDQWAGSDQGKRMQARVLLRAALVGDEEPGKLRRRAIELMNRLTNKNSQDSLLMAELYLLDGQFASAVSELRVVSESLPPNVDELMAFLRKYDRQLFSDTRSRLYADRIYDQLEEFSDYALGTLDLRLETTAARTTGDSQQDSAASSTVIRFARRLIGQMSSETEQFDFVVRLMQHLIATGRWEYAQQMTKLSPELLPSPRPAAALATALAMSDPTLEQVELLRTQFDKWLSDYATNAELQFAVGNLHFLFGENEQAITLFRRALERAPNHSMTMNNLALALLQSDDTKVAEAQELLGRAIQVSGRTPVLLDSLAVLKLKQDDAQEAVDLLLEALPSTRDDATIYLHLARAWERLGDQRMARFALSMAESRGVSHLTLVPSDREAYARLQDFLDEPLTP